MITFIICFVVLVLVYFTYGKFVEKIMAPDAEGFDIIWRYFAWSNQTLSVFTLWAMTVYLYNNKRKYTLVALLPALLMTMVTVLYILIAPEGFTLPYNVGLAISTFCVLLVSGGVFYKIKKSNK